jgi:hypothetical protein
MTKADERLKAIFAADEPPPRDAAFTAAVIEALERRRFLRDMALLAGVTVLGGLLLWALWPTLEPALVAVSQGLAPAAAALALAACLLVVLGARPGAALGLDS